MRIAIACLLAGCARSAPAPHLEAAAPRRTGTAPELDAPAPSLEGSASELAQPCDLAGWKVRAASPLRGRIAGIDVIEVDGGHDRSQVFATFGPGVFVAGEVENARFERVVTHETGVARTPGGPWLPGVVAEPGLPVSGSGAWLTVQTGAPLEVSGFVPVDAIGTLWTAQDAAPAAHSVAAYSEVLAAPAFGAEQVAAITGSYNIVDRTEDGPPGWQRVEAHTAGVRATGWIQLPRPSPLHNVYDFSDDTIEATSCVRIARRHPKPGPAASALARATTRRSSASSRARSPADRSRGAGSSFGSPLRGDASSATCARRTRPGFAGRRAASARTSS